MISNNLIVIFLLALSAYTLGVDAKQMSTTIKFEKFSIKEIVEYKCVKTIGSKFENLLCSALKGYLQEKNTKAQSDNNKLAKLGFTYTSDIFIDEGSPKVQLFNKKYLEKNYAYPSYYTTKGFDIVFDVVMRLASGDPLKETFKKGISTRLESKFNYNKSLFSTSTNTGIYILQYNPDLTITRIK